MRFIFELDQLTKIVIQLLFLLHQSSTVPSLYGLCLRFAAGVRSHAGFLLLSCLKEKRQQKDQLVSGPCGFLKKGH